MTTETPIRSLAGEKLLRDPLNVFAIATLLVVALIGLIGPYLPLGDPKAIGVGPVLAPPSSGWILGTDELGRSLLPRVVQGVRATLVLSTASVAITMVIGTVTGLAAGYLRGALDEVVVRLADLLFSFPAILMAILVSAIIGPGQSGAVIAIVVITTPLMIRVVRAATLVIAQRDFVTCCVVAGGSLPRVLFVHLLPNVAGPAIVQATYAISVGMLIESAMSFLGLGVQAPDASLGSILHDGVPYLLVAPWMVLASGSILAAAILAVNLFGDGLRDALDPREARLLH